MEKWQDPKVIALWIAIIIVLIFTILLFVVRIMHIGYKRMTEANLREARMQLEHQKKLTETNLTAQERERQRIASDLHDGLIGKLAVVRLKSQMGAPLQELDNLLEESIAEARRISHDPTPPLLEFLSLEELLEQLADPWREKLQIDFYSDVRAQQELTPQQKIQVVRIVQELVTNTLKHAAATTITMHLRHTEQYLALRVHDNGKGFDASQLKKGIGLSNLELRMQYLNAGNKVKSEIGKGTTTIIAGMLSEATV